MIGQDEDRHWHLDRRVPIALIMTIVIQTAGMVWWASNLSTRVEQLERQHAAIQPQAERIIRLETQLEAIRDGIAELKLMIRGRGT